MSLSRNGTMPLADPGELLSFISALWHIHPHTAEGVWLVARTSGSPAQDAIRVIEFHCDSVGCRQLFGAQDAALDCADRLNGRALRLIVTRSDKSLGSQR